MLVSCVYVCKSSRIIYIYLHIHTSIYIIYMYVYIIYIYNYKYKEIVNLHFYIFARSKKILTYLTY